MSRRRSLFRSIAAAPHVFWSILFIICPLVFVAYYAFTDGSGALTFENILSLSEHKDTFILSIALSVIATFICFLIGYPLAYIISQAPKKHQSIYMLLLMLPMWTNLLIRTYSMLAIMDDGGLLNHILEALDLGTVHLIGTKGAVILGMVYDFLPYMVLPIYTVMSKIDPKLIEAARDLGCSPIQVLLKVTFPLSMSGVISGVTMVFVPSISTFYISQKLGGGTFELIGDTIERQFQNEATYNIGAAIALVMMILILISLAVMNRFSEEETENKGVML